MTPSPGSPCSPAAATTRPRRKARAKNKGLSSLSDITPGDYGAPEPRHWGICGHQRLDLQGVVKDYIKINYDKADTLYVPVTQLDLISRYTAPGDGRRVKLSKLGGDAWNKTKSRVRKATQEMAKELIALYARRQQAQGYAFPEDNEWQRDFETRFEYDETADQLTSAAEIKKDMEKPHPMDRLLCGDVGVGKTEVALRAAFKCIMGGKQVAVLVPTTILAWQHYTTILSRMEAFPVKAGLLSRFASARQQKETIKGLAAGTVDVVVGTHRMLQKDVKFHDLGLVIIDEEQRFGVKHKEKLKENFIGVDMLTLSATPIPRTLNMAMSGLRDMSTIEEPPFERRPIETYVMEYDAGVVAEALRRELDRGGQAYYIHNRIDTIDQCAAKLAELLPGARIATAHGRMDEATLSGVWQKLLDGEIDVLVCTTLIETGVDVRNCNTLIIEDADRMGLAQLYQIRGRVGRSGRKAYAYFAFRRDKVLTDIAAKRLSAIREFTSFGSGFRIAMRDLQIRGAGNLLGQSQHGHMEAVGYEMYVKLLNQAIAAERGEAVQADKSDCLIDITVDAYIPEKYIPDAAGRIEAYKRIAAIDDRPGADDVLDELADRYGPVPKSVQGLIDISLVRVVAAKLGIYEITQNRDTLILYSDKLDLATLKPLLKDMGRRPLVNASGKPYLSVRILPGEKPLDVMNAVFDKMELERPQCAPGPGLPGTQQPRNAVICCIIAGEGRGRSGARAEGNTLKLKKFTGLLLCAALALSMAACKFTTPAVVMTVEGEDIPAGLYLMYQYQAYSSAKSKLEDKSAKVLKSEIEGLKAEEWIHNETVASAKRYVWVEKAFAEAGLTFTEEEQASIDSQLDTIWANNEALLAANGIGRENYRRFYECEAKYEKLLAEYQDGESDKITDAEAKKYMDETYSRIQTLVLPTTDADSAALPDEKLES
ncbi:MAG: transcription-repair coupling factor [Ruthenibacterium lactatiformans]